MATGIITNKQGKKEVTGDLILMFAIDKGKDDYQGIISSDSDKIKADDYVTIAKAVIQQCFEEAIANNASPSSVKAALQAIISEL
jgi:L-aminopeptidase/D-esterase-like protein